MKASRLLAWSAVLALAACGSQPPASSSGTTAAPGASATVTGSGQPPAPATSPPPPGARLPDADLAAFAKANNAFAFALWPRVAGGKGDFAYSPFSAEVALAMTWLGAKRQTDAQMKAVLGFDVPAADAASIAGRYARSLGGPVTIRVANRLFGERSAVFEPSFLEATGKSFGAPLEPLDFRTAAEPSRVHINQWVARETRDRIKDLIPPSQLSSDTRLVLVNAIYFLGDWLLPFKKAATRPEPFHTSATAQRDVPMMHQQLQALFTDDGAVRVLDLPYEGGDFSMTFVLPGKLDGLAEVERGLSAERFAAWIAALARVDVNVALPRFTIDPPAPLDLGGALIALGMTDAFDPRRADFTGIANPPNPADRLSISKVFHKAFVKVDEKGTEAAAATAVAMTRAMARPPTAEPRAFRADHPFLFFLRDAKTNAILFAGRVADPQAP